MLILVLAGCTYNLAQIQDPPRAVAVPSAFPWESMIYAARTSDRVFVVDLGWYGSAGALRKALRGVGAGPDDVTDVFLTHSHRDHIAAWRQVPRARFHVLNDEAALLTGMRSHRDVPSRVAQATLGNPAPWPGEVDVQPFTGDTVFVLGADTLRAFELEGHTAGSAAYLFRGVLFVGDALFHTTLQGWRPAKRVFTDSPTLNRASLASLRERIRPFPVRWVCTAHAKCGRADEAFLDRVLR
ncbi:MAG TPA: MBL fold metallo-hydrolase [Longimicrobiaceae bacterium]|nr:MBL fold metallo-hydrolase [Longimicrobiaceae bacterium]